MSKDMTRREVLGAGLGFLLAAGVSISFDEAEASEGGKKIIKLKVKVPKNIEFSTQIEQTDVELPLERFAGLQEKDLKPAELSMDLTSEKTMEWLQSRGKKSREKGGGSGTACCVRG